MAATGLTKAEQSHRTRRALDPSVRRIVYIDGPAVLDWSSEQRRPPSSLAAMSAEGVCSIRTVLRLDGGKGGQGHVGQVQSASGRSPVSVVRVKK